VRWSGLKKIRRVFGRRTRQTEETCKSTRHLAESAGMCAACRGDVSHPAELGQDLLKALEPNFAFDEIRTRHTPAIHRETGRFCCGISRSGNSAERRTETAETACRPSHASKKKGRSDSIESDGLFLIRRGQAVSHAADLTLTCRPVSQAGRRLSQFAAPVGGGADFSRQRGLGSQFQASLSLDRTSKQCWCQLNAMSTVWSGNQPPGPRNDMEIHW
jgi:hypothetical protein